MWGRLASQRTGGWGEADGQGTEVGQGWLGGENPTGVKRCGLSCNIKAKLQLCELGASLVSRASRPDLSNGDKNGHRTGSLCTSHT